MHPLDISSCLLFWLKIPLGVLTLAHGHRAAACTASHGLAHFGAQTLLQSAIKTFIYTVVRLPQILST